MSLPQGTQLGPYRIDAPLGAGGMGEVYRARDTRLDRDVAIKVVHEQFTDRFQSEARAISRLNHPHICTLHDVGPNYLVMELLDGESLADRLTKSRLPVDAVIRYGSQIADALAAAHTAGIIHRDLKPANIMLMKAGAKVLDFGIARLASDPGGTITATAAIIGTPAYMAPEQLAGTSCDRRTDIFALGLVLHEMATGKRAIVAHGHSPSLGDVPEPLAHVIERCLAIEPDDRWQSASDVRHELQWAARPPAAAAAASVPSSTSRARRWRAIVGVFLLLAASAGYYALSPSRSPAGVRSLRLSVNPPLGGEFRLGAGSAVSPDGRFVAYVAHIGEANKLWVRALDSLDARELSDTEGAAYPFWSPDSRTVGFFAAGALKRIEIAGGKATTICRVASGRGGTWNADGVILFNGYNDGPILRVPASGGEPQPVTTVDVARTENSHRWPRFLPDGEQFLFYVRADDQNATGAYLASLKDASQKRRIVTANAAWFAPTEFGTGHLLWVRDDWLVAQPFDPVAGQVTGDAVPVVEGPFVVGNGVEFFSVSNEGTLVYEKGEEASIQLTWVGRDGKAIGTIGTAGAFTHVRLSGDAKRALVLHVGHRQSQVWLADSDRNTVSLLQASERGVRNGIWAPDGRAFAYAVGAPPNIFMRGTDGVERRLTDTRMTQTPSDWSRDGRYILFEGQSNELGANTALDLWALPLMPRSDAVQLTRGRGIESNGRFSPDGQWIAYESGESGRPEIYVQRFPTASTQWRATTNGGSEPVWRGDGREMFYLTPDGTVMAMTVDLTRGTPEFGVPTALFRTVSVDGQSSFDASADGQRFLTLVSTEKAEASPMIVITNLQMVLKQAAPH